MENAIEVKRLSKQFGSLLAVNDISFNVRRGEVLGFLGPNGAGKSTTMKMIAGFLEPTNGTVSLCGHDVLEDPISLKKKLGYLPEGAPAYGEMTPKNFLNFIADIRGLQGSYRQERIDDVVKKINIDGVMNQPIETLSKGFKRRVGMAQAILHDPEVLIMDEPTDGLDPNQKHEVRTLIQAMAQDKAIIISTHILEEVGAVCDRAIIIAKGQLLFNGTPKELISKSKYHNAVSLTIKTSQSQSAKQLLSNLPSVENIELLEKTLGKSQLLIIPKKGMSIVGSISDLVHTRAWEVGELRVETGRVDEVFRDITIGSNSPALEQEHLS